jgi:uncharacterized tellurite resistance protein B-like protein
MYTSCVHTAIGKPGNFMQPNTYFAMSKQDLYIGLGSLLYALAKTDGRLQPEEFKTIEQILQQELNGEIALYSFQLREAYNNSLEEAYGFALRRFKENRKDFDAETRKKFMAILQQVALAHDGISRKEKELLKRCRRDIARL